MSHSIVLLGAWFGPWPTWIDFFLLSCGANRDIDWLIVSDQLSPASKPDNVRVISTSFQDYVGSVGSHLSISLHDGIATYKICDYKPALGYLYRKHIHNYDFFGFTDLDVIYGHIRGVYDEDALGSYDALSSHATQVSGHLFLMRNTREMRSAFMSIPDWKAKFTDTRYVGFDEHEFYKYFQNSRSRRSRISSRGFRRPYLFRETYSTPMPTIDVRWYWKNGLLSNEVYGDRHFLYLHFMVWHSNKWYPYIPHVSRGTAAPWQNRTDVVQIDWRRAKEEGFMISAVGIQPIQVRPYP